MGMVAKSFAKRRKNALTADLQYRTSATVESLAGMQAALDRANLPASTWRILVRYFNTDQLTVDVEANTMSITLMAIQTHKKNPSKVKTHVSYRIVVSDGPSGLLITTPVALVSQGEEFGDKKHYSLVRDVLAAEIGRIDPQAVVL